MIETLYVASLRQFQAMEIYSLEMSNQFYDVNYFSRFALKSYQLVYQRFDHLKTEYQ